MIFLKEHLRKNDYDWYADVNQKLQVDPYPTRRAFNRFNGDCVLHMINMFNRLVTTLSLAQCQNIELLISKELPLTTSSEISVFNWLKSRFVYTNPDVRLN